MRTPGPLGGLALRNVQETDHGTGHLPITNDGKGPVLNREAAAILAPEHLVIGMNAMPTHHRMLHSKSLAWIAGTIGIGVVGQIIDIFSEQISLAFVTKQTYAGGVGQGTVTLKVDAVDRLSS